MVPAIDTAAQLIELTEQERRFLGSSEVPIVIAPKQRPGPLSDLATPSLGGFGITFPYSGIYLLLCNHPPVVVSGNLSSEPVCTGNTDASKKLDHVADAFVFHDREIHVPVEDLVFIGTTPSCRSRGFALIPVPIITTGSRGHTSISPSPATGPGTNIRCTFQSTIFVASGELENTLAIMHGDLIRVSAHIGDVGSWISRKAYQRAVGQLLSMRGTTPELIACDPRPGYVTIAFTECFAAEHGIELFAVQHRSARALSLLAEHHPPSPDADRTVIITLDGTEYGTSGSI